MNSRHKREEGRKKEKERTNDGEKTGGKKGWKKLGKKGKREVGRGKYSIYVDLARRKERKVGRKEEIRGDRQERRI